MEKLERPSREVLDPTVQTDGSEAGEELAASTFSLPAATARKTPERTRAAAALLTAADLPPPRDKLATAPLGQERPRASEATKLMPAMTPELESSRVKTSFSVELWIERKGKGGGGGLLGAVAVVVEDLDGVEVGLLGHAVGGGADGARYVRAVAVAIRVAVVGEVCQEASAATELLGDERVSLSVYSLQCSSFT